MMPNQRYIEKMAAFKAAQAIKIDMDYLTELLSPYNIDIKMITIQPPSETGYLDVWRQGKIIFQEKYFTDNQLINAIKNASEYFLFHKAVSGDVFVNLSLPSSNYTGWIAIKKQFLAELFISVMIGRPMSSLNFFDSDIYVKIGDVVFVVYNIGDKDSVCIFT